MHSLEVLLVHPGGPSGRNKDVGLGSIPKGKIDAVEDPEDVVRAVLRKQSPLERSKT